MIIKKCIICGEMKKHYAKGKCLNCYHYTIPRKIIKCKVCNQIKKERGKGMCGACLAKETYNNNKKKYNQNRIKWKMKHLFTEK